MTYHCRHCHSFLDYEVIDLGHQPPSNAYITPEKLDQPEVTYPLKVYLCTHCWLMQIPEYASFKELFSSDYAYFSSVSTSWCNHAEKFVVDAVDRLNLDSKSLVVEIASNDGYLLKLEVEADSDDSVLDCEGYIDVLKDIMQMNNTRINLLPKKTAFLITSQALGMNTLLPKGGARQN